MIPPRPLPPPRAAVDPLDDDYAALLDGIDDGGRSPRAAILRDRVLDRVVRSARASRAFVTVRFRRAPTDDAGGGVTVRTLYEAGRGPRRRGEPQSARLVELRPGARWPVPAADMRREWLVVRGAARLGALALAEHDFHRNDGAALVLSSDGGALVFLREDEGDDRSPLTRRDAGSGWDDFAPGIRRRVLACGPDGEASMLVHALPGAAVPRHGHGHDEECLMLDGELFLDEVLLRRHDYQLAPAGTVHGGAFTDTGVVLYAHGDLELDVRP